MSTPTGPDGTKARPPDDVSGAPADPDRSAKRLADQPGIASSDGPPPPDGGRLPARSGAETALDGPDPELAAALASPGAETAALPGRPGSATHPTAHGLALAGGAAAGAPGLGGPPAGRPPMPGPIARWPGPAGLPTRPMLVAVAATAVAAAFAVPEGRPGLGWFVTAVVAALSALWVEWSTRRAVAPRAAFVGGAGWTVTAVALAGVGAVRAAGWLAALCLLAALGAAGLAAGGRGLPGIVATWGSTVVAAARSTVWFARAVGRGESMRLLRLGVAVAVGALLLAIFVPLMAAADPAFDALVSHALPRFDGEVFRLVFLAAWAGISMAGLCFLVASAPVPPEPRLRPRLRGLEWTVPAGLLVAVFVLFVGVQAATLFGGDAYVRATAGVTYAEYARGGFWQLLWITILAFGVILVAARVAPVANPRHRAWRRGLLGALAVLTLVVVASATHRMVLYQQAYGYTVLRLLVLTCELWLGLGFLIVLASVLRTSERAPTRALFGTGVAALLALAVLDPERFVAEENLARFAAGGSLDVDYMAQLSADAVPALATLPEPYRSCALRSIATTVTPDDWRSANVARAHARGQLAQLGITPDRDTVCPSSAG